MKNEMKVREWLLHAKSCYEEAYSLYLSPRKTRFGMQVVYNCCMASEMILKAVSCGLGIPADNSHAIMLLFFDIDRKMKGLSPDWTSKDILGPSGRLFGLSGKYRYPDAYDSPESWKRIATDSTVRKTLRDMEEITDYAGSVFKKAFGIDISRHFMKHDIRETAPIDDSAVLTSAMIDGTSEDLSCWLTYSRSFSDAANNRIRQFNKTGKLTTESKRFLCHYCQQATELMLKGVLRFHGIDSSGHNLSGLIRDIENINGLPPVPKELKNGCTVLQRYDGDGKYPVSTLSVPTPRPSDTDVERCIDGMAAAYGFGKNVFAGYSIDIGSELGAFTPLRPKQKHDLNRL